MGFVTGRQLAAARQHLLAEDGWDVGRRAGRRPAPRVVAGEDRNATIDRSLRLLGLGTDYPEAVSADGRGALGTDDLADSLGLRRPRVAERAL